MKNRSKSWRLAVLFACLSILLSLGRYGASDASTAPPRLSITYVASPLNLPTIVERSENLFEKAFPGTKIVLPDLNAGPKQTAAMAAGEVDFAHCLGATSAILAASEGLDIRIVGIYSRAPKAFMIVTKRDDIQTAEDLKGRKIGGPKGTILHQLLAAFSAKAGLSAADYEFINMGLPAAASALENGSIDAALLAGPDAYHAAKAGARTITNGVGYVDATTVIATTERFLKQYPDVVERFLQMHRESIARIESDVESALKLGAKETGLPIEVVTEMYPWYDFSPAISDADIEELKRTQDFMLENGLQRNRIDIDSIVTIVK